ncbi:MAG: zf-HC2 domain-containing protein [Candidatus Omnitrophota bacterium]
MRCKKVKHFLPLFLDGQLGENNSAAVKTHMKGCLICSRELKLLEESWDLLGKWDNVFPSPNFKAVFWQRISQEEEPLLLRKPIFVFPRFRPILVPALASFFTVLIAGIYFAGLFFRSDIQRLTVMTQGQDIQMLKELDLAEDFHIILNMQALEDFEVINSLELT